MLSELSFYSVETVSHYVINSKIEQYGIHFFCFILFCFSEFFNNIFTVLDDKQESTVINFIIKLQFFYQEFSSGEEKLLTDMTTIFR